jgi:hypothetical protein
VYKKWRILKPKLSIQHYTLIEKLMLNKPLNSPFFIHAVMRSGGLNNENKFKINALSGFVKLN